MQDFAQQMRRLVDEAYPEIAVVRVVLDNLNTHRVASLYESLPGSRGAAHCQTAGVPLHAEARKLVESSPELVEGMAEIEFSVLSRSCLRQRLPDEESLSDGKSGPLAH